MGQPLDLEADPIQVGQRRLEGFARRTFTLTLPGGITVTQSLDKWGAEVKAERLEQLIVDAKDGSSPLRRHYAKLLADLDEPTGESLPSLDLPIPISLQTEAAIREIQRMKDRVDQRPHDARLNIKEGSIFPHREGRWLDVDATLLAMDEALREGKLRAEAVVVTEPPRVLVKKLEGLKFKEVLGHFETRYSREKKAEDRTFNLRLAASRLDGTVLLPGETFDFNQVVGPRDEANGYKVATVIADGELVDGIGGGTCQISGTLHGAVFFAGLDIVERYPHTRPSSYIKMGMDATVVYPTINFRFENQYDFPVAIHQIVEDGIVRAEILGPTQDQVVTLIRKVDEAIAYEQIEKPDATMPKGTRALAQRGIPGFRLHRYRTIRKGSHTRREKWRDVYPPTPQVIRVGTGNINLKKKSSVTTPEYRADEVLILTQRRPENGQPGEHAENREPGKYGEQGWTKEAGMPLWEEN
jgi:vancomycin resistance protein YoaR